MKSLTEELMEYDLSAGKIKRILATLSSGKTVRSTGAREIACIFLNDESEAEAVIIDSNGREKSIFRKFA